MDGHIDSNEVFQELLIVLQNVKNEVDLDNRIRLYIEEQAKDIKESVDIEPIIQEALYYIKNASNVKPISIDDDPNQILNDTLNLCYVHKFESELALESFKELAKYDKVFHSDQGKHFHKIYQMLSIMVQYKELIENLEKLEDESVHNRGIAKTKYENVSEAIQPNLHHYEKALEFNDIEENKLAYNIAQAFNSNPREVNAVLETFDSNLIKDLTLSQKKTFENQNTFYNSSEKLEDTHLFRSCQITCINLFKKQQPFAIIEAPTNEKLANYINHIFNDFFDMYESKLNRNHINKLIQTKTYFLNIEIFEYQTAKNKKEHPIFI